MKKLFFVFLILLFPTITQAEENKRAHHSFYRDGGRDYGDYHHASTPTEGYLSGYGRYYRGAGQYLRSMGQYLVDLQYARSQEIENHRNAVHVWWQLKDEYKMRFRAQHPPWPERKMRQLNMAKARYEVLQIE